MSRIRSIHPGIWTDEVFVGLSDAAQIFFIALWTECDDQGAFEWKPLQLRLKLRGARDGGVEGLLAELVAAGSIRQYEHNGKKFGLVRNFGKFQRPKKPKITFEVPADLMDYAGFRPSADDIRKIKCDEQDGRCFYCDTEITHYSKRSNSLEIDHMIPKSRNGSDDIDNLVAACRACNRSKHDMTADEFIAKRREKNSVAPESEPLAFSRAANVSDNDAKSEISPQRKEEGGRMKEGKGGEREEGARAAQDPVHKKIAQGIIDQHDEALDDWESDFLRNIVAKQSLTKAQAESLKAIQSKIAARGGGTVLNMWTVVRGTPQFTAWVEYFRRRDGSARFYEGRDSFTAPTEFPPSEAAA